MPIPPGTKGKRLCKIGAVSYAKLMRLLLDGIYTCKELAEDTGLHYVTVCNYVRALYKEGVIHIADYEKDRRGIENAPIYKVGRGEDKKRFKMTDSQKKQKILGKEKARGNP